MCLDKIKFIFLIKLNWAIFAQPPYPWHISVQDFAYLQKTLANLEKAGRTEESAIVLFSAIRFPCYLLNKVEEKKCQIEQNKIIQQNEQKIKRIFLSKPKEIFYNVQNRYYWLSEELMLEINFSERIKLLQRQDIRPEESKWEIHTDKTKLRFIWFKKIPLDLPSNLFLQGIKERFWQNVSEIQEEKITEKNFLESYLIISQEIANKIYIFRRHYDAFVLILEGDPVIIRNLL